MEGPSIFENLFGGFSNGLSIFANNPFRRTSGISSTEDASAGNDEGRNVSIFEGPPEKEEAEGVRKKLKTAAINVSVEQTETALESKKKNLSDDGVVGTGVEPPQNSETSHKKAKRPEDQPVSERKRRKTESCAADEDRRCETNDNCKRKQVTALVEDAPGEAGLESAGGVLLTKKHKKRGISWAVEFKQQFSRQSACTTRKSLNEEIAFAEGGEEKVKLKEILAEDELVSLDNFLSQSGKRSQDLRGVEKPKKKKRVEDTDKLDSQSRLSNKSVKELAAQVHSGVKTRSGLKRKKDDEVEELFKRKRRDMRDGNGSPRIQGYGVVQSGVDDEELADVLRVKRKPSFDDVEENGQKGLKKTRTTKEVMDNEERLKRTVFVGNLPVTVKPKQLTREFSQFGAVESARLRSVPLVDSKLPRKAAVITGQLNEARTSLNGYVVFQKEESARAALAHNMTEFKGKHLRVDKAAAPSRFDSGGESGIEYDEARSIFVGNLSFDVEDEEVYSLFNGKTPDLEVEAVRVVRDPQTSIGKGFAFVCFKQKVGATTALANAQHMRLRNRQLRVIRFGFQKKQMRQKVSGKTNKQNHRSRPRPGIEERLSKKGVLSYEGARSSKSDGRPGKLTGGPIRTLSWARTVDRRGSSKSGKGGKSGAASTKRPAVAARKLVSQGKPAFIRTGDRKRKKDESGILYLPSPRPMSTSAHLTEKLWGVVRSVGSYASSSFKDFFGYPEINSGAMSGSIRKLLLDIEKRPDASSAGRECPCSDKPRLLR